MNRDRISNEEIIETCVPVVVRNGHPDSKDDYEILEYQDDEGDNIRLDRKPIPRIAAIAPFAGKGSDKYPMCPFCGEPVQCEKHYAGKIVDRANLFRQAVRDITRGTVDIEFRDGNMDKNYGIVWSGNLEYAIDPALMVKGILNDLLNRALQQLKDSETSEEIKKLYELMVSGEAFTYSFKYSEGFASASWEISCNLELKNRFAKT